MKSTSKKRGFTLVEIAIVLLIIGLVSSAIMVGGDLVRAASIRSQITQFEQINTMVNVFRDRYGCLPGDCVDAVAQGFAVNPASAGNGNGIIEGATLPMWGVEPNHVWYSLEKAELVAGDFVQNYGRQPGIASPLAKMQGKGVTPTSAENAGIWLAPASATLNIGFSKPHSWLATSHAANGSPGTDLPTGVFLPSEVYAIDIKVDDGFPDSGNMRAATGLLSNASYNLLYQDTTTSSGQDDACVDDAPPNNIQPVYNVKITDRTATSLCVPVLGATF
ncbi:MAG: type II secretion system protein [Rickettsiales bacterium]